MKRAGKSKGTRGFTAAPVAGQPQGTIRAVAEQAGVAISTVSRYLSGKKRLAAETEKRIVEAVALLGYAPNRVAQSLRQGRTMTVGLLLPDSSNPFFSGLVKGAEDALRSAGFALVLFNSNEETARELEHLRTMQSLRCDGALVIPAPETDDETTRYQLHARLSLPVVYVARAPGIDADLVMVDSALGGYEATRYLVRLGHRRIAVLAPDYRVSSQIDRVLGYRRALGEVGVTPLPEYEVHTPLTVQDGFSGTTLLLQLQQPPTAIFATSNPLAIGAVAAIKARGLRCPQDISVAGYDSYEWQEVFEPRLTSIKQPSYLLGQRAAELLLDNLSGRAKDGPQRKRRIQRVMLRAELVIRDSCQPPAGA